MGGGGWVRYSCLYIYPASEQRFEAWTKAEEEKGEVVAGAASKAGNVVWDDRLTQDGAGAEEGPPWQPWKRASDNLSDEYMYIYIYIHKIYVYVCLYVCMYTEPSTNDLSISSIQNVLLDRVVSDRMNYIFFLISTI